MTAASVLILGSTGSIGRQALQVAERCRDRIRVQGLAARRSLEGLADQAARWKPSWLALEEPGEVSRARTVLEAASPGARLFLGPGATARLVAEADAEIVLNGIVGSAGLGSTLAALGRQMRVALANKESLVVGGPLVKRALARGGSLIPVDSEHSAALQCLGGRPPREVRRLTLTASGGALRDHPDWKRATAAEVLAHPVWAMGTRITVDSALLVNKGLELIEARWLFDLEWEQLEAVLHPQVIVHALAAFHDGSLVMQAAAPDMKLPIQLAFSWPEHWGEAVPPLAVGDLQRLEFAPIPAERYPAFRSTLDAGRRGGTAPCVLNAADEVAVQAFLDGQITLGQIPDLLARVLDTVPVEPVESLDQLAAVDARARDAARTGALRT